MPLSDVVSVAISVSAKGPTAQGFGEPLIAAYTTRQSLLVQEYSSLADMVAQGYAATDPAYLCAEAMLSQQPTVPLFKIGRRTATSEYTQVLLFTALSTSAADVYAFSVGLPGLAPHAISVPSTGVPATDVVTIAAAITALSLSGVTASHSGSTFTITMAAGKLCDVLFPSPNLTLGFKDNTTVATSLATDLAAILSADPNWYGLLLDSQSPAEISAAATWAEANDKAFICNCSDTEIADPASTTDVAYTLMTSAFNHPALLYSASQLLSYSAAAWMGQNFPSLPGSENWAFKTLAGVPADNISTAAIHAVENKNASVYTPLAGLNLTQFGKVASGEFIDIPRFIDWLQNQIQIQILGLLANNNKIPYTDAGVDQVRGTIMSVLQAGVDVGGLSATPAPFVSVPLVASLSVATVSTRNLPKVSFSATLAGAINSVTITGVVQA
jgi:hypothetical protein